MQPGGLPRCWKKGNGMIWVDYMAHWLLCRPNTDGFGFYYVAGTVHGSTDRRRGGSPRPWVAEWPGCWDETDDNYHASRSEAMQAVEAAVRSCPRS